MKKGATKPLKLQPKSSTEMFCINFNSSLYRSSKFESVKKINRVFLGYTTSFFPVFNRRQDLIFIY